ncbi:MAG: AAA family ATPase [Holophagales bacterium]|jgi:predicted ATP-dependent endonuclease of OLD family|nr:AAA family ATPase [Holophagales bacterium]
MAIKSVEIKDFLVFRGGFAAGFCPGVNVLIGGNGTGKTTLMKVMYAACNNDKHIEGYFDTAQWFNIETKPNAYKIDARFSNGKKFILEHMPDEPELSPNNKTHKINLKSVYIPEKDMLSNSKGLPETVKYGKAQFNRIEIDIIEKARVLATRPEQDLYRKICNVINGEPENDGQNFFIKHPNIDKPVPFSMEASGYRKFGLLAALIRNEQIKSGSVLFWDEPENSLNPELAPVLVDILLELSRSGVQMFLATHDYNFARYFDVRKDKSIPVMFHNLSKTDDGHIICNTSPEYVGLPDNLLETASADLFKAVIANAMEIQDDE